MGRQNKAESAHVLEDDQTLGNVKDLTKIKDIVTLLGPLYNRGVVKVKEKEKKDRCSGVTVLELDNRDET